MRTLILIILLAGCQKVSTLEKDYSKWYVQICLGGFVYYQSGDSLAPVYEDMWGEAKGYVKRCKQPEER